MNTKVAVILVGPNFGNHGFLKLMFKFMEYIVAVICSSCKLFT
jgi:hypothetical protein